MHISKWISIELLAAACSLLAGCATQGSAPEDEWVPCLRNAPMGVSTQVEGRGKGRRRHLWCRYRLDTGPWLRLRPDTTYIVHDRGNEGK